MLKNIRAYIAFPLGPLNTCSCLNLTAEPKLVFLNKKNLIL